MRPMEPTRTLAAKAAAGPKEPLPRAAGGGAGGVAVAVIVAAESGPPVARLAATEPTPEPARPEAPAGPADMVSSAPAASADTKGDSLQLSTSPVDAAAVEPPEAEGAEPQPASQPPPVIYLPAPPEPAALPGAEPAAATPAWEGGTSTAGAEADRDDMAGGPRQIVHDPAPAEVGPSSSSAGGTRAGVAQDAENWSQLSTTPLLPDTPVSAPEADTKHEIPAKADAGAAGPSPTGPDHAAEGTKDDAPRGPPPTHHPTAGQEPEPKGAQPLLAQIPAVTFSRQKPLPVPPPPDLLTPTAAEQGPAAPELRRPRPRLTVVPPSLPDPATLGRPPPPPWLERPPDRQQEARSPPPGPPPLSAPRHDRPLAVPADVSPPLPHEEAPTYGRRIRRVLAVAAATVAAFAGVVLTLVMLYRWVDPPASTLMLGQWIAGTPINRQWMPLERMSPNLVAAVILSEDGQFCRHRGVDWRELRELIDDGAARGGSTITMQVAKNLFLWPSRSYLRKAVEIPLALTVDALWPKRRILEIYLNIAEWGPGVFGAEAAARYHFRKSAQSLSPREAALLAVALPNPFDRRAGKPGPGTQRLADNLLLRMRVASSHMTCLRPRPPGSSP